MTNNLVKQLNDLRVRAGNPSYRELKRTMEALGRRHSMARSTIQEKLTGKSQAKLHQILSLVAAIAEYGRVNGTPLSPQEIDENSWRAKFVASSGRNGNTATTVDAQQVGSLRAWDSSPLRHAGMTDLLDLIERSEGAPITSWLPHVASEMFQAQMSCESLMKWAAQGSPREAVECIAALDETFPRPEPTDSPWGASWSPGNSATVMTLLRFAARAHGGISSPVIVVGLRRSEVGRYVEDYLRGVATWHLAPTLQKAVESLRSAELTADATRMLTLVGSKRREDRIMEVVRHFDELGEVELRDAILQGMAMDEKRFMAGIRGTHHEEMQGSLIAAIPHDKKSEYADLLSSSDFEELASKVRAQTSSYYDEPPF
ncbi:hypothetical protein ACIQPS_14090 [Streptomyces sp. NPDC091290]|uniref:hypothetical protein n=1 Tax=Streptomyces sp. NPDC091290 TaxID=3365990 RepID=UPI0038084FA6